MIEDPIDLSAVSTDGTSGRWESLAVRIEAAAKPELERRAWSGAAPSLTSIDVLLHQRRRLMVASVVLAFACGAMLLIAGPTRRDLRAATLSELTGITYEAAGALSADRPPALSQFLFAGESAP